MRNVLGQRERRERIFIHCLFIRFYMFRGTLFGFFMGEYLLKQFMKILLYTYVSKKRNLTMDTKMKGTNVYTLRAY